MKNFKTILGMAALTLLLGSSCEKTETENPFLGFIDIPTKLEFSNLRTTKLSDLKQEFLFNAENGTTTFISEKGVSLLINGACLRRNGDPVTGEVNITFIEIFDKGNMLTTNKPTMGLLPSGDKSMLVSGGEFLVEVRQDGVKLQTNCGFQLNIPTSLTGGDDNEMSLWKGIINEETDDLAWRGLGTDVLGGNGEIFIGDGKESNEYYTFFNQFGWSNVDRFYNDPRPKTTILVAVPNQYNYTNSAVYLSYDGENTGLANLDSYSAETGLFSEHYGQIPIGLECHVIFATEADGDWRYAIKKVTIVADETISFSLEEMTTTTNTQFTQLINELP